MSWLCTSCWSHTEIREPGTHYFLFINWSSMGWPSLCYSIDPYLALSSTQNQQPVKWCSDMCYLQNTKKSNKHLLFSSCTVVKQPEIAVHFSSPDILQTTRPLEMSASPRTWVVFVFHLLACYLCQPKPDELCLQCKGLAWFLWDVKMIQRP